MLFKRRSGIQDIKDDLVMSKLLSNAFKSVKYQLDVQPVRGYSRTSIQKARCRLNLYAMNTGILNYFLTSNLEADARQYIQGLNKNLVEIICHADPEVFENIENLILDKDLMLSIHEKMIGSDKIYTTSKREILNLYLKNRIQEYQYKVGFMMKIGFSENAGNLDLKLRDFPITKIFCKDCFDNEISNYTEFSTKFSYNIVRKSVQLFAEEVEEIIN